MIIRLENHGLTMLLDVEVTDDGIEWNSCRCTNNETGRTIVFCTEEEDIKKAAMEFEECDLPDLTALIEDEHELRVGMRLEKML
jgi:hypothetical protein